MPPRLQCLNAARQLDRLASSPKAVFSVSARALAERDSSAASLLSAGDDTPYSSRGFMSRPQTNSFNANDRRGSSETRSRSPPNAEANARLMRMLDKSRERRSKIQNTGGSRSTTVEELEKHKMAQDLNRMITRRYKAGEVYAPHDLSPVEMQKWRRRGNPERDVFDALDMNPIEEYKNFSIMSEYMTPMGRIKHSLETGLRPRNQRKIAKAIRRSIGLGMMPSVHKHPEILQKELQSRNAQMNRSTSFLN